MVTINEKSREKLAKDLELEITNLFQQVLDYSQVACPTKNVYEVLRSKILRAGNNCIRITKKRLQQYEIGYIPQAEEIIEIKQK